MACNLALAHEAHRGKTRPAGCSLACRREYAVHHVWAAARSEALERSGLVCARCGLPTIHPHVHHVRPVPPGDYSPSCRNHQANLLVLCGERCHVEEHRFLRHPEPRQLALPLVA